MKIFFFLCLLLVGIGSHAQDTDVTPEISDDEELTQKKKELETMYSQLYLGSKEKKTPSPNADKLNIDAQVKSVVKQLHPELSDKDLKKMKLHQAVDLALAPIRLKPEGELASMIHDQLKPTSAYPYLKDHTKHLVLFARIIQDKNALPSATKIIENKSKLKTFAALLLLTIIIGIIISRVIRTSDKSFLKIFLFFLLRVFLMLGLRLGLVIYFFGEELTPMYDVVKNYIITRT